MGPVTQGPGDTQSQSLISDLGIRDMPLKVRDCHPPKKCCFFFNGTEIKYTVNWLTDKVALSASFLKANIRACKFYCELSAK